MNRYKIHEAIRQPYIESKYRPGYRFVHKADNGAVLVLKSQGIDPGTQKVFWACEVHWPSLKNKFYLEELEANFEPL